ncbi:uncharacterized protein STEHIDRAFT_115633 [Stereum hirsutum FP-91666 SS1]|uniref:uncharacterized protein n=1 Tax=Stereum hirsutum (strain FP-91666) TaxID=721885 RepID=UPI000444A835|nr:uncharacterized protein STEHIDRAFT_115633 [Stereum hirsutum FP-91666 SS1]EIM80782.1 hypothetical protein STEHIDRAFT_115633 [Stereum hirsutum FP-91666 SS1]
MPKLLHVLDSEVEVAIAAPEQASPMATSISGTTVQSIPADSPRPSSFVNPHGEMSADWWDERRDTVKVPLERLWLSPDQKSALQGLYTAQQVYRRTFSTTTAGQDDARNLLSRHSLNIESRGQLESRWTTVWSTKWRTRAGDVHRVLVQCACGYNTAARQQRVTVQQKKTNPQDPWSRHAPYDFTGCLAHADVTYSDQNVVTRVVGILDHNDECREACLVRYPAVPLHPHVLEVALAQLASGARIRAVRKRNTELFEQQAYRDQKTTDPLRANYRYELLKSDYCRLHRRHHQTKGIDVENLPQYNIDEWLQPGHPNFKHAIYEAVFHYARRTEKSERFQMILDGTFGVSTSRLLLFIAMGIDEERKGVPIALFLFSAPTGNRATHAGYDTKILTELLTHWKQWMTKRKSAAGRTFGPGTVITDTDTKERGALSIVWPNIILLLCKFHLRQCWTNKRTTLLGKREESFWKTNVNSRLRDLENALIQTTDHNCAQGLIDSERNYLRILQAQSDSSPFGAAGIIFLDYLTSTWMSEDLWKSWSQRGRNDAATRLGVPVDGILPTTNHLESFNGVLKNDDLPELQRAGRRLRFDVLIFYLITKILPRIFAQLRVDRHYLEWRRKRFTLATGGATIPDHNTHLPATPFAWFSDDERREADAVIISHSRRLCPIPSNMPYELWATCATSSADVTSSGYPRYWLSMHASGAATCSCPDWLQRGGACKHLRAFRLVIKYWTSTGQVPDCYLFPATRDDALDTEAKNKAWYGDNFAHTITAALSLIVWPTGCSTPTPPPNMIVCRPLDMPNTITLPPPNLPPTEILSSMDAEAELENLLSEEADTKEDAKGIVDKVGDQESENWEATAESSNRRAIATQIQNRVDHEVAQLLPKLHGLASLIGDAVSLKSSLNLLELHEVLQNLSDDVGKHLKGDDSYGSIGGSIAHLAESAQNGGPHYSPPKTPPRFGVKRDREMDSGEQSILLQPSPEAKQRPIYGPGLVITSFRSFPVLPENYSPTLADVKYKIPSMIPFNFQIRQTKQNNSTPWMFPISPLRKRFPTHPRLPPRTQLRSRPHPHLRPLPPRRRQTPARPPRLNTGTLHLRDVSVRTDGSEKDLKKCELRLKTTMTSTEQKVARHAVDVRWDGEIVWMKEEAETVLPVRQTYSAALVVAFKHGGITKGKHALGVTVLWLRDIVDREERKIKIPLWREKFKRIGTITLDAQFLSGIPEAHRGMLMSENATAQDRWDEDEVVRRHGGWDESEVGELQVATPQKVETPQLMPVGTPMEEKENDSATAKCQLDGEASHMNGGQGEQTPPGRSPMQKSQSTNDWSNNPTTGHSPVMRRETRVYSHKGRMTRRTWLTRDDGRRAVTVTVQINIRRIKNKG